MKINFNGGKIMFNNTTPLTMPVAPIGYTNNSGFGGFGNDWIGLIVILAILGWGGNGFGGFGGFGGGRGLEPCATQSDVRDAVDQQTLISKLDQQTYGLADSTYALNNAITNGFHGVDNAICNLGYNVQSGFNALGHQLSDCCCQTQRAIDGVNYNMATQACDTRQAIATSTRDIIDSQNAGTRAILDFLTTDKIAALQAENQTLKFKASQAEQNAFITANQTAQTAELIRRLGADCPVPAYVVPNPNCCYNPFGFNYGNGYNNGCGCA